MPNTIALVLAVTIIEYSRKSPKKVLMLPSDLDVDKRRVDRHMVSDHNKAVCCALLSRSFQISDTNQPAHLSDQISMPAKPAYTRLEIP
jgi:hypothetical protein